MNGYVVGILGSCSRWPGLKQVLYGREAVKVRRMLVEPKTRADDAGKAPLDPIVNASSPSAEDAGRQWHALLTSSKPISNCGIKGIREPAGLKGSEQ